MKVEPKPELKVKEKALVLAGVEGIVGAGVVAEVKGRAEAGVLAGVLAGVESRDGAGVKCRAEGGVEATSYLYGNQACSH